MWVLVTVSNDGTSRPHVQADEEDVSTIQSLALEAGVKNQVVYGFAFNHLAEEVREGDREELIEELQEYDRHE